MDLTIQAMSGVMATTGFTDGPPVRTPTPPTSDPGRSPSRSGQKALVIGGTGPSGPDVVHGLLNRGFDTTIFHAGVHEVPLPGEVRHIHGDPHFRETITEALGNSEFDVVIAQYCDLRPDRDSNAGSTA